MLKLKVDAGAHYIVTQMFFINEHYFAFVKKCRDAGILVPIIPGIKPIGRKSDIDLLPQTFHVDLPSRLVEAVSTCGGAAEVRKVGIEYCKEQVSELLGAGVPGVHFYTQGRADSIARIVESTFRL
jgi:methylenetetrahydrofolate reductase (NADPH)